LKRRLLMTLDDDIFDIDEAHLTMKESGVFTWDLSTNILHADAALADLFGIEPSATIAGLPVEAYLERIVSEDRPSVAQAISNAVLTGDPYHEEYRVLDRAGEVRKVMAFGRCFRDADGVPSLYAGIVFPVEGQMPGGKDPVLTHVAVAHLHAVEAGRTMVADALETILEELLKQSTASGEAKIH
jgi:PAS domain-containing protein